MPESYMIIVRKIFSRILGPLSPSPHLRRLCSSLLRKTGSDWLLCWKFTAECADDRFLTTRQYLMKLWRKPGGLLPAPSCRRARNFDLRVGLYEFFVQNVDCSCTKVTVSVGLYRRTVIACSRAVRLRQCSINQSLSNQSNKSSSVFKWLK